MFLQALVKSSLQCQKTRDSAPHIQKSTSDQHVLFCSCSHSPVCPSSLSWCSCCSPKKPDCTGTWGVMRPHQIFAGTLWLAPQPSEPRPLKSQPKPRWTEQPSSRSLTDCVSAKSRPYQDQGHPLNWAIKRNKHTTFSAYSLHKVQAFKTQSTSVWNIEWQVHCVNL